MADASYYLFRAINSETFWVEHDRFVLIVSQILPWLAVKMGAGLPTVLWLYSLGHVLFFYVVYLIVAYGYGEKQAGLMLLMVQTLGITSGFFVPVFELYYAAGLLVLFWAVLNRGRGVRHYLLLGALTFFILTAHPYAMLLFLFVLVSHFFEGPTQPWKIYGGLLFLFFALLVFKVLTPSEYEQGKTQVFLNNLKNGDYGWAYIRSLIGFMMEYYGALLSILGVGIGLLFYSGRSLLGGLIGAAFLGILVLVNLSLYDPDHSRYQEQVWFPLSFVASWGFVRGLEGLGKGWARHLFVGLAFLVIILRVDAIRSKRDKFRGRVAEMERWIARAREQEGRKFVIHRDLLDHYPNWSYTLETLLLSSREGPERTLTICTEKDRGYNDVRSELAPGEFLFRRWEIRPVEALNPRYFRLGRGPYQKLQAPGGPNTPG